MSKGQIGSSFQPSCHTCTRHTHTAWEELPRIALPTPAGQLQLRGNSWRSGSQSRGIWTDPRSQWGGPHPRSPCKWLVLEKRFLSTNCSFSQFPRFGSKCYFDPLHANKSQNPTRLPQLVKDLWFWCSVLRILLCVYGIVLKRGGEGRGVKSQESSIVNWDFTTSQDFALWTLNAPFWEIWFGIPSSEKHQCVFMLKKPELLLYKDSVQSNKTNRGGK